MKIIPLTQGKFTTVDDEDFEYLNQWKWFASFDGNNWYAVRLENRKLIQMHREVMRVTDPQVEIDHRDGNGLRNWRKNLRACTHAENGRNRKKSKNNTSGFKGVTFEFGAYRARIKLNYKVINLGRYKTGMEAARAYDRAAKEHHGEFAGLNFPT